MAEESIITVDFVDWKTPKERFDASGRFSATRVLRCAYADRITLMRQLKGGFRNDDTGTWVLPASYPVVPEARVLTVDSEPHLTSIGADSFSMNDYKYALITVVYNIRKLSFQSDPTTKLEHNSSFSSANEFLNVAVNKNQSPLFYRSTGKRADQDSLPQRLISIWQWHLSIRNAPNISARTQTQQGIVNLTPIDASYIPDNSSFTFPAGTLRYDSCDLEETVTVEGEDRWNVVLHFSYINMIADELAATATWNHAFPPASNTPTIITTDAGGANQYKWYGEGNLNLLLDDYI